MPSCTAFWGTKILVRAGVQVIEKRLSRASEKRLIMSVSSACRSIGILILFTFWGSTALCQNPRSIFSSEAIQFFEMKIRPLLQNNCVGCHNNQKPTSGLSLESREALLAGGNHGTIVQPGNPEQSLLIHAVEYEGSLKMP